MKKIVLYIGLILALPSEAQEDSFYQLQYREKVLHYNQDIKAADYQVSMRTEMTQSARANFLPKLSADADFKYTGNPLQLTRTVGTYPSHSKEEISTTEDLSPWHNLSTWVEASRQPTEKRYKKNLWRSRNGGTF